MTTQQLIERALVGGWRPKENMVVDDHNKLTYAQIMLDPEAWKAVGKVKYGVDGYIDPNASPLMEEWKRDMHRMIDALAEGKTIEQYLETL